MMIRWTIFHCKIRLRVRYLSTVAQEPIAIESSSTRPDYDTDTQIQRKKKPLTHKAALDTYFEASYKRQKLKHLIPEECLGRKKRVQYLYLIDPKIAEKVSTHIITHLQQYSDPPLVVECYPGLGLITKFLLKNSALSIKLYEPLEEFRIQLERLCDTYSDCIQLFSKDFYKLRILDYLDKLDNGNRIDEILTDIPKKSWISNPLMTIIGTNVNISFIRYLVKILAMQTSLAAHGRIELFFIMYPRDYIILSAEVPLNKQNYRYITVLFNLFFDFKLIEKVPRKAFLPWEAEVKYVIKPEIRKIDEDKLYFVHMCFKKNLPLPFDQLVPFYFFIRQLFRATKKIVPTLERWVPGCGDHIIWPRHQHRDYYENMSILTEFRDLSPEQLVSVFKEMCSHPTYIGSPFLGMVETELMKQEAIEYKCVTTSPELDKAIVDDIKLSIDDS